MTNWALRDETVLTQVIQVECGKAGKAGMVKLESDWLHWPISDYRIYIPYTLKEKKVGVINYDIPVSLPPFIPWCGMAKSSNGRKQEALGLSRLWKSTGWGVFSRISKQAVPLQQKIGCKEQCLSKQEWGFVFLF